MLEINQSHAAHLMLSIVKKLRGYDKTGYKILDPREGHMLCDVKIDVHSMNT